MLQIITRKYFRDVQLYERRHRGVLYTNSRLAWVDLETEVARLLPSTTYDYPGSLTYEIVERLEAVNLDGSPSNLVSISGRELANDLSAVLSFALNITCSPDFDLVRRLTVSDVPVLGQTLLPRAYVSRVFDKQIFGDVYPFRMLAKGLSWLG